MYLRHCGVTCGNTSKSGYHTLGGYFPLGWINSSGNNVTDEAVDYIMPLIQGEQDIHYQNGVPIHFKLSN